VKQALAFSSLRRKLTTAVNANSICESDGNLIKALPSSDLISVPRNSPAHSTHPLSTLLYFRGMIRGMMRRLNTGIVMLVLV
jgi:hypothetical protein